jgi:carboxylate-amine ligase
MIRFYLGEEPILRSVRSYDLSDAASRAEVLERLPELVIKPRAGLGGKGVVICAHADPGDVAEIRREIEARPQDFIAQETIELSTHPTVVGGRLEPRHVDLRAYAIGGELVPAPLTRFARERGALVVNSSEGGGAKDTWLLN